MLKVFNITRYYSTDDSDWRKLGDVTTIDDEFEPMFADPADFTFDEVWNGDFPWIYKDRTPILHRRLLWAGPVKIKEQSVRKISFMDIVKEDANVTLDYLIENQPADLVIQYMKERGLSSCPVQIKGNG